jgi:2-desacetyl-2-hydroxyethyl bacteriochlorophyllide A dehydrogenase
MRAAVIQVPGEVVVTDVPDPVPRAGEVVVRVAACGICGTDLHILDGEFAPAYPIVPGHELAGEVVEIGADALDVRPGDRVAVDPSLYCGHCHYCRRGRDNLCENYAAIGVTEAGAAAEYVRVPARNCLVLPDSVATVDAPLIEPLSCAVRGFDALPRRLGDHYLIYGAGTMGLMMLELAKRAGAGSVSVLDLNPERLATARALGCSGAATVADEVARSRGFDVVVDCTGAPSAIADGLSRVGRGGVFLQFGVAGPDARVDIAPYRIYHQEITITGSMAVLHSFERAGELQATGLLDPAVFISDRYPLERYPEAIAAVRAGTGRKIQVLPGVPEHIETDN